MKGQLTRSAGYRQAMLENRLSNLGTALALLEHDRIRVRQAIERGQAADLLVPVLEDIELIGLWIRQAQAPLGELWKEKQEERWDKA